MSGAHSQGLRHTGQSLVQAVHPRDDDLNDLQQAVGSAILDVGAKHFRAQVGDPQLAGVQPHSEDTSGLHELRSGGQTLRGVRRVVENPDGEDDIEGAWCDGWVGRISLDDVRSAVASEILLGGLDGPAEIHRDGRCCPPTSNDIGKPTHPTAHVEDTLALHILGREASLHGEGLLRLLFEHQCPIASAEMSSTGNRMNLRRILGGVNLGIPSITGHMCSLAHRRTSSPAVVMPLPTAWALQIGDEARHVVRRHIVAQCIGPSLPGLEPAYTPGCGPDGAEPPSDPAGHSRRMSMRERISRTGSKDRGPLLVVAAAVLFGLIVLWPERADVWYLNDASVHRSMVRWAADRIRDGHMPFDGWYPYLSLGASRFHHYQSLPHILTGTVSLVGGDATFRWSLYLLLGVLAGVGLRGRPAAGPRPLAGRRGSADLTAPVQRSGPRVRVGELRLARIGHVGAAVGDVGAAVRVGSVLAGGRQGQTSVAGRPGARDHDLPAPAHRLPRAVLRRRVRRRGAPGDLCDGSDEPPSWWRARCSRRRGCSCRC